MLTFNLKFAAFQKSLRGAGRPPRTGIPVAPISPDTPSLDSEGRPRTLARDNANLSPHIPNTPGDDEPIGPGDPDTPDTPDSPSEARVVHQHEPQRRRSEHSDAAPGNMSPRQHQRRSQMSERRAQMSARQRQV